MKPRDRRKQGRGPRDKAQQDLDAQKRLENWKPKTRLGQKVLAGEILDIEDVLDGIEVLKESEIVDKLLPNLERDLLMIGQSKGKFGGGQRRVFKQTQKKTREGNKPQFSTIAVVGNKNGIVGVGHGKARETVPAREKALRRAKLNIFKIRRGCGSWQDNSQNPHSIPFKVTGKCGSIRLTLLPAPRGKGLIVEKECQKILSLAGITDVVGKCRGKTSSKVNVVKACVDALQKLMITKITTNRLADAHIVEGGKVEE